MTIGKLRFGPALRGALLALAAWSLTAGPALACGEAGGTCSTGKTDPASQSPGALLNVGVGNPINVMSGNKYLREEDMPALPGVLGLEIVRHYNSAYSGINAAPGNLGRGWKLSYETQLQVGSGALHVYQADGAVVSFSRDLLRPSVAVAVNPANGVIHAKRRKSGVEYTWRWTDGKELTFDERGKLMQIRAATGEVLSLVYDAQGLLVKVTDPQGRSLRLAYLDRQTARRGDRFRGVQAIDSPLGRFAYEYGSSMPKGAEVPARQLLGNLVRVRHPAGGETREYHYEDARHPALVTGISVGGERFATYAYDAAGRGVLSTHADDMDKVTLDFERPGLTTVTNSKQEKTTYRYSVHEGDYRLGEVRGPGCVWCGPGNRRFGYDRDGRLTEITGLDDKGVAQQTVRTELDYFGRPVRVTRTVAEPGKGSATRVIARYEYGDARTDKPTLVARPSVVPGREALQRIVYNANGQPVSVSEHGWSPAVGNLPAAALERTTRYRYRSVNGRSLLVEVDGPLPNGKTATPADSDITRFDYDRSGSYLTRTVAPGNLITEVRERDAALRPLLVASTDGARLVTVQEELAPSGRILKRTESAWLLDGKGNADRDTRQVNVLEYRYDARGRLQTELAQGQTTARYRYDGADNLIQRIAPDGSSVVRAFDSERQVTAETRYGPAGGGGIAQRYDTAGADPISIDWRSGRVEQRWADATQPWNASYGLGQPDSAAEGLVEEVTRPDGSRVRRWFDDFGRVAATQSPEHGLRVGRYDAADGLVALRDALGVSTTIVRDAQGRAVDVRYADAAGRVQQRIVYRYAGLVLAEETRFEGTAVDSRIEWRHDAWGRTSGKQLAIVGADGKAVVTMKSGSEIDRARNIVRQTLPSGAVLRYHYDAAGNVQRLDLDKEPLLTDVRHAMTLGGQRPVSFRYGNGRRSETRFNADGTLASHLTGTDILVARHDPDRRRSWFERAPAPLEKQPQVATGWRTLLAGMIGSANAAAAPPSAGVAPVQVIYDSHRRLIGEVRSARAALAVRYDELGNRLDMPARRVDAAGNVLELNGLQLAYNARGELRRVTDAAGAEVATYRYDGAGHRIAKRTGGDVRYFMYEDGQLLAEADRNGRLVAEYIYLGRRPVARLRYDAARDGWLGGRGDPVIEYLHTDQRSAVETVTDAGGKLVWRGELDAFGVLVTESGAQGTMPLRLSGQYADRETGLYYNVHRYYDPQAGRYLQADPLGLAAGMNMYAYVENDPLNGTDPLGLNVEKDDGWAGIIQPWLFGTFVHSKMANQVRLFGPGWGANDERNGTWKGLRPDAYYVDPTGVDKNNPDKFIGTLWELKPITWASGSNYNKGLDEVKGYIRDAKKGCWTAGSSSALVNRLEPDEVFMGNATYEVNYVADKNDKSGLLFYTKKKLETKKAPQTVPAPSLSKKDADELAKQMQALRNQGKKEGWSVLQEIGMVVLVGLAIAAAIAVAIFAATTIAAIISAIAGAIAAAASGTVALMAALAAVFAFGPGVAAAAETKGKEKEQGMLDGAIDWFKSWF